ncbi:Fic/DOC family protein [Castellaniella sp.]|uniref:Fic/DOC family protein n=1 Tax=Castellaniella sp. TaxID=1955812 RepID=UPI002AFE21FA|nr:Fic family protein [Castellaniella sp.]
MTARNDIEQRAFDRLRYPGPEPRVPVNKLDIRDWENLELFESQIVAVRLKQGLPEEAQKLNYAGFKALHRHMFQDVYEWAGEERSYTTGRNKDAPFARPEHITSWMEKQFKDLKGANYLQGLDQKAFAHKAADLVNEINAAHPFIEGNGRVQRAWLQIVSDQAGHAMEFRAEDKIAWNEAARIGFLDLNTRPMAQLLETCIARAQTQSIIQDRQPLLSAERLPDLPDIEIYQRAQEGSLSLAAKVSAEKISEAVYGRRNAISAQLQDIADSKNPSEVASDRSRAIMADSEAIGPLQGRAAGWLRGPDDERREAMKDVVHLAMALEKYGHVISYERQGIIKAHRTEQERLAIEIPAPSPELTRILSEPQEKQLPALQRSPEVATELSDLVKAAHMRLTREEKMQLASDPGAGQEHSQQFSRTYRAALSLNEQHEHHKRQLDRRLEIGPVITR